MIKVKNKKIFVKYKHECYLCKGQGGIFNTCSSCNGEGVIKKNDGFISINVSCSDCNNTGKQKVSNCENCNGYGYIEKEEEIEINIPEGFEKRTKLFINGKGNYINGTRGDLFISVEIIPNDKYKRQGNNIVMEAEVNIFDVLLENTVTINTFREDVIISLNPSIIKNDIIKPGLGTKSIKGNEYGNLIIKLSLNIPSLTNTQKTIINNLITI